MRYFLIYLLLASLFACSGRKKSVTHHELISYINDEDNGLVINEYIDELLISVRYRPLALMVYQELEGTDFSQKEIDDLVRKYGKHKYFVLSLSRDNQEALHQTNAYSKLVETLSFKMSEFVFLTTSNRDTIPISDYTLDRTFGMNRTTDLIFAFDNEKIKNTDWVQFNLNEFGLVSGNQRFRFMTKDLDLAPQINFQMNEQ